MTFILFYYSIYSNYNSWFKRIRYMTIYSSHFICAFFFTHHIQKIRKKRPIWLRNHKFTQPIIVNVIHILGYIIPGLIIFLGIPSGTPSEIQHDLDFQTFTVLVYRSWGEKRYVCSILVTICFHTNLIRWEIWYIYLLIMQSNLCQIMQAMIIDIKNIQR